MLCALVLAFAAAPLRAETTIYVGKHFEVRDHDAPVKYVFNGQTRVARITGSLSANERIQRLRLRAGWNLVSLAVTAPDLLGQWRQFMSGSAPAIKALYRWQAATRDYAAIASEESVAAGTVLWLSADTDVAVALRGGYVEPSQWGTQGGETFVATPALEAQALTVPAGVTLWRYGARNRRWQAALTGDLASLSDLPSTLPPGEAIYVHSNEPTDLGAPPPEERIRYYHQDHLGSSSVMTDANGTFVEETAFYPFGIPRHEHRLRHVEEAYKFTQKERDRESGLHHFEARHLAANLSRFVSADPKYLNLDTLSSRDFGAPQALNLYAYVHNNPLRYVDPKGLERFTRQEVKEIQESTKGSGVDIVPDWERIGNLGGGALLIAGGIGACATIKGCVVGAPMIMAGSDRFAAGITGEDTTLPAAFHTGVDYTATVTGSYQMASVLGQRLAKSGADMAARGGSGARSMSGGSSTGGAAGTAANSTDPMVRRRLSEMAAQEAKVEAQMNDLLRRNTQYIEDRIKGYTKAYGRAPPQQVVNQYIDEANEIVGNVEPFLYRNGVILFD